jgi:hypothetical protein
MSDSKGILAEISEIKPIHIGYKGEFPSDQEVKEAVLEMMIELYSDFSHIAREETSKAVGLIKHHLEPIGITEGTELYKSTDIRLDKVLIVGIGSIGGVLSNAIKAMQLFEQQIADSGARVYAQIGKLQQYGGEMNLGISKDDLDRLEAAYMKSYEYGKSVFELTCDNFIFDMEINYELLDTSNRISHHPRFMQRVAINYRSPALRPAIVRRGSRQSKRGDPNP